MIQSIQRAVLKYVTLTWVDTCATSYYPYVGLKGANTARFETGDALTLPGKPWSPLATG